MKKRLVVLTTIALALTLCAPALASSEEAGAGEGQMTVDVPVRLDLDGDGAMETVCWESIGDSPEGEGPDKRLRVTLSDGAEIVYEPKWDFSVGAWALDLDGDGRVELLLSGDEASDDYVTVCLHLFKDRLEPAMFADCSRSDRNWGYDKYGYGSVSAIDGNRVTLCGSQDMLGTWFAAREFELSDTGVFEFADEGKWVRDMGELDDDAWEYMSLTSTQPLPYTTREGQSAELPTGTRIIIVATDKVETADFITRDGLEGTLSVERDEDRGWGVKIDGRPEDDCFEYIPYAD